MNAPKVIGSRFRFAADLARAADVARVLAKYGLAQWLSDVDWETRDGHYRVYLDGEWLTVPDDAVITEPNRSGKTMVWPMKGYLGTSIRCFMPGSMT